jgi:ribosomal protein L37E
MPAVAKQDPVDAQIGERLHTWMWRNRIPQTSFADVLGISQQSLGRKLRGDSAWTAGELARAAAALDVSVGWLFGEAEPLTRWSVLWQHVERVANRYTRNASRITCPRCGRTSYNPNDVREGYCGNCHDWTHGVRADDWALAA